MSTSTSVVAATRHTGSTPHGAHHWRLLQLRWWLPSDLPAAPPRVPPSMSTSTLVVAVVGPTGNNPPRVLPLTSTTASVLAAIEHADCTYDRTTSGSGSSTRISLSDSEWSKNTINPHNYNTKIYWSSSISYYNLGLCFKLTKGWSPKDASKDITEFAEAVSLMFKIFSSPYKRMPSISTLSLRIPVQSPTLMGLDFPLTTFVGNAGERKQFLTCTQKTTRAKLERLCSARLIQGDQKITTRHTRF
jgi:hypothetical protein